MGNGTVANNTAMAKGGNSGNADEPEQEENIDQQQSKISVSDQKEGILANNESDLGTKGNKVKEDKSLSKITKKLKNARQKLKENQISKSKEDNSSPQRENIKEKQEIWLAVGNNDIEKVKNLLSTYAYGQEDLKNNSNETIIHIAAKNNFYEIIQILYSSFPSLSRDLQNQELFTPIHSAISNSCIEATEKMLELGSNLDIQDSQGRTPIHLCCILKNIQILSLIYQYINSGKYAGEINLNILDKKGFSSLHYLILDKNIKMIEIILNDPRLDINLESMEGVPYLIYAVKLNCLEIVKLLLSQKANIYAKDRPGFTGFHYSISMELREIISLFFEHEVDIDCPDKEGRSAIYSCLDQGKMEMFDFLIEKGANLQHTDNYGHTCLYYRVMKNDFNAVKLLIEKYYAEVNYFSMALPQIENKIKYLKNISEKELAEMKSKVPLHISAARGHLDIAAYLIEKGALLNIPGTAGITALHIALLCNQVKVAKFLIEKGADVNIKDSKGISPLDLITLHYSDSSELNNKSEISKNSIQIQNDKHSTESGIEIKEAIQKAQVGKQIDVVYEEKQESSMEQSTPNLPKKLTHELEEINDEFGSTVAQLLFNQTKAAKGIKLIQDDVSEHLNEAKLKSSIYAISLGLSLHDHKTIMASLNLLLYLTQSQIINSEYGLNAFLSFLDDQDIFGKVCKISEIANERQLSLLIKIFVFIGNIPGLGNAFVIRHMIKALDSGLSQEESKNVGTIKKINYCLSVISEITVNPQYSISLLTKLAQLESHPNKNIKNAAKQIMKQISVEDEDEKSFAEENSRGASPEADRISSDLKKINVNSSDEDLDSISSKILNELDDKNLTKFVRAIELSLELIFKLMEKHPVYIEKCFHDFLSKILSKICDQNSRVRFKVRDFCQQIWNKSVSKYIEKPSAFDKPLHFQIMQFFLNHPKLIAGIMSITNDIISHIAKENKNMSFIEYIGCKPEMFIEYFSTFLNNKNSKLRSQSLSLLAQGLNLIVEFKSTEEEIGQVLFLTKKVCESMKPVQKTSFFEQISQQIKTLLESNSLEKRKNSGDPKSSPGLQSESPHTGVGLFGYSNIKSKEESSQLPYAEPLTAELKEELKGVLSYFSEPFVQCLYSNTWSVRKKAISKMREEMIQIYRPTNLKQNVNITNIHFTEGIKFVNTAVVHGLTDAVISVQFETMTFIRELIEKIKEEFKDISVIQNVKLLLGLLVSKLGDGQHKIREKANEILHFGGKTFGINILIEVLVESKTTNQNSTWLESWIKLLNIAFTEYNSKVHGALEIIAAILKKTITHNQKSIRVASDNLIIILNKIYGTEAFNLLNFSCKATENRSSSADKDAKRISPLKSEDFRLKHLNVENVYQLICSQESQNKLKALQLIKAHISNIVEYKQESEFVLDLLTEHCMILKKLQSDNSYNEYYQGIKLSLFSIKSLSKYLNNLDMQMMLDSFITTIVLGSLSGNMRIQIASDKFLISLTKNKSIGCNLVLANLLRQVIKTVKNSSLKLEGRPIKQLMSDQKLALETGFLAISRYMSCVLFILKQYSKEICESKETLVTFAMALCLLWKNYPEKQNIRQILLEILSKINSQNSNILQDLKRDVPLEVKGQYLDILLFTTNTVQNNPDQFVKTSTKIEKENEERKTKKNLTSFSNPNSFKKLKETISSENNLLKAPPELSKNRLKQGRDPIKGNSNSFLPPLYVKPSKMQTQTLLLNAVPTESNKKTLPIWLINEEKKS